MQGDEPQGSAPRGTILIVEDNELNLKLLKDVLDFQGYSTVVTGLGAAAFDLARQHRPDLILCDLHLPDMDGTEVLQRLRGDARTQSIPVIIVSADAMPHQAERLKKAGADAYVTKPLNVRELLGLIKRSLEKSRRELPSS